MTEHMQEQILEAFRLDLVLAGTSAGDRVRAEGFNSRPVGELPAIDIDAGEETRADTTRGLGGQSTVVREFMVHVSCMATGSTGRAARAMAMELQARVEERMGSPAPGLLSGLLRERPRLMGVRRQTDDAGAQPFYTVHSVWLCRYITAEGAPRGPAPSSTHP